MNCPICGKPTLIGAKLCSPCRSALKRARDDTVFELPGTAARQDAPSAEKPGHARAVRRTVAIAALGLAAFGAAAVHLAHRDDAAGAEREAMFASVVARPADDTLPVRSTAPVLNTSASAQVVPALDLPPQPVTQPPRSPERFAPRAPKPAPAPVDAAPPPPLPMPTAEPVRDSAPPPPAPNVPVDPWQGMNGALARCGGENLFDRIGCEYRVRAKYCEGHWGEVPQCPGGVTNDHGQ